MSRLETSEMAHQSKLQSTFLTKEHRSKNGNKHEKPPNIFVTMPNNNLNDFKEYK